MTAPVTVIPALAPVLRPVFGADEGCGKTVIISGEVVDEGFVKDSKELDAGDVMLEASDVIVETRNGSVEEETKESDGTAVYKDIVNCSGEGASKLSLLGLEQPIPFEPQQQDHKPLVGLKTISCSAKFAEQID